MAGAGDLQGPDLGTEGIPREDLGAEVPAVGHYDGKPVAVVATPEGIRAVGGSCTHYGGPLGQGLCAGGHLRCPWHHAAFDLGTGRAVGAPALDPIPVYEVSEGDGRVFVIGRADLPDAAPVPPVQPDTVVIVGSGAAGAAAAEELRKTGYRGPVTIIGVEPPVDRPNLSKDYLAGNAPEEWIPLRSADFYAERDIDLLTGVSVTRLDRAERIVELDDGRRVGYGALLLATGAEPRRLPLPGADSAHVHYLRSLEDSRAIISALSGTDRAVVVGAGFIGLEVAASLRHRGLGVTVVAPEEIPLAHAVGEAVGRFVAGLHSEHGVDLRLGRGLAEIGPDQVVLDDGTTIACQLVVVGVGVAPRTGLAEAAGLEVDNGVVVDDRLRTADPHIWAAGDVASYAVPGGGHLRVEHWVAAERQGQAAARNILGHNLPFRDPPFFWSQHYDVRINVTGHAGDWDDELVAGSLEARDAMVGYRRQGRIRAVATIGRDRDSLRAEQGLAAGNQQVLEDLFASAP